MSYFSTVAGSLNAMAAVILRDIINPVYYQKKAEDISERNGSIICRVLGKCAII